MNPFWSNIFSKPGYEDTLAYFLGTVPIFHSLSKRDLDFLQNMVHVRNYRDGEIVFTEGDIGSGLYAIRSGKVRIYVTNDSGHDVELAQLGPGDFFGEVALTSPKPRIASAITQEPTVLVGLFRSDMLETVRKHPAIASKILLGLNRVLSDRLQAAYFQLQGHYCPIPNGAEGQDSA